MIDYSKISEIDWARLAAYVDGEGCLSIAYSGGYNYGKSTFYRARLAIGQADVRLVNWLKTNFGGTLAVHIHPDQNRVSKRAVYYWSIEGQGMEEILKRIRQYLIVKVEQADLIMAMRQTMTFKSRRKVPQEVLDKRADIKKQLEHIKRNPPDQEMVQ